MLVKIKDEKAVKCDVCGSICSAHSKNSAVAFATAKLSGWKIYEDQWLCEDCISKHEIASCDMNCHVI